MFIVLYRLIVENNFMIKYIVLIYCLLNLRWFYKNSYLFPKTMQFSLYWPYWIIIHTIGGCFVKQIYYLSNTYFYLRMSCDVVSYWAIKLTPLPFPTFQISAVDSLNLTSWWLLELWSEDYVILERHVSRLVLLF